MENQNSWKYVEFPDGTYQVKGEIIIPNFQKFYADKENSIYLGKEYNAFYVSFIDSSNFNEAKLNMIVDFVDKSIGQDLIFKHKVSILNQKQGLNLNAETIVVTYGEATECYLEFNIKANEILDSDYLDENGNMHIRFIFEHLLVYPEQKPLKFNELLKEVKVTDIDLKDIE